MASPNVKRGLTRVNNFAEIGIAGRKTGLRIADNGNRDEYGMEDMDAFFSPDPPVPAPLVTSTTFGPAGVIRHQSSSPEIEHNTIEESRSMDIADSVSSPRRNTLLPRRTPVKTNIGSPARRNDVSVARKLSYSADFNDHSDQLEPSPPAVGSAIRSKPKRGLTQQAKKKVFQLSDYDVADDDDDDDSAAEEVSRVLGSDDVEEQAQEEEEENVVEAELRKYKEIQEREQRESEERLRQLVERKKVDKQSKNVLQLLNTNVEKKKLIAKQKPKKIIKKIINPPSSPPVQDHDDIEIEEENIEVGTLIEEIAEPDSEDEPVDESEQEFELPKASKKRKALVIESKRSANTAKKPAHAAPSRAKKPTTSAHVPKSQSWSNSKAASQIIKYIPSTAKASETQPDDGLRRSSRVRVAPLSFWKNERIVYDLDENHVPKIKEIVQVESPKPRDKPEKLDNQHKTKSSKTSRLKKPASEEDDDDKNWDGPDRIAAEVMGPDPEEDEVQIRQIGYDMSALKFASAASSRFEYAKTFEEGKFFASGILKMPVHGEKTTKSSKHNFLTFFVVEGQIMAEVHESRFKLRKGGHMIVPRNNTYSIRNIGKTRVILFFVQTSDTSFNSNMNEYSD
ncbi:Mif2/CENP-C like-domain-containing protein [Lipomyces japonicus]|uniref:Mif2/CENP-C like-domain-containing protein n=1 Tax=Lipomyces japonicus TaxID=56871 RepID=UPI0034CF574A